ncbi:MAG: class I SAM-dependent methyltransferase [Alphaproteobacteria bacterium]
MNQVSKSFETGFLSETLAAQVDACDRYELASLFLHCFAERQPVLEAGCGSGRWCAWLQRRGIRCDGVDWSQELCDRAAQEIPGARFFACDMSAVPVPDGAYGGIVALGSIEHTLEGPSAALREFRRLLRPGGVAVITMPYGSPLRRLAAPAARLMLAFRASPLLRRLFGKRVGGVSLAVARRMPRRAWGPQFGYGEDGWFFYEYRFNKTQARAFLGEAGLAIREEFVGFGDEGILHHFGRLAGRWNRERAAVDFTPLGRWLRAVLPVGLAGHMLCYVVERAD